MNDVLKTIACRDCGHAWPLGTLPAACPRCGGSHYEARYALHGGFGWPRALAGRPHDLWRYHELLPIRDPRNAVTMGEGGTPLIPSPNLGALLGLKRLYLKDERQNPTGSFKARQASLVISSLAEHGVSEIVVASTGNVAMACAAYAARAGIRLWAFTVSSLPIDKMREIVLCGAHLVRVTGTYDQVKQTAARFAERRGLTVYNCLRSVAAVESMKTIGFELAEQLGQLEGRGWRSPDWYIQAVSGGMGPVGVAKGFQELEALGLVEGLPRLGLVQSAGCDPMVRAFEAGLADAPPFSNPSTRITTVATDVPGREYRDLRDYVQAVGGAFVSVDDAAVFDALRTVARLDGISVEPATALTFAGLFRLMRRGVIDADAVVVVNVSGHTRPVESHVVSDELRRVPLVAAGADLTVEDERALAGMGACLLTGRGRTDGMTLGDAQNGRQGLWSRKQGSEVR